MLPCFCEKQIKGGAPLTKWVGRGKLHYGWSL